MGETTSLLPSLEAATHICVEEKYQWRPLGDPYPPYLTPPSPCPGWIPPPSRIGSEAISSSSWYQTRLYFVVYSDLDLSINTGFIRPVYQYLLQYCHWISDQCFILLWF